MLFSLRRLLQSILSIQRPSPPSHYVMWACDIGPRRWQMFWLLEMILEPDPHIVCSPRQLQTEFFSNNFSRKYWRIFLVTLNLREVYLSLFSSSFFPLPDTELVSVGGRSLEGILVWGLFLLRSSSGPTGDKVTGQSPSSSVLWYSHTASLLVYCPGNLSILSSQFKLPCSSPDKARTVKWSLRLCPGFQGKNMK